MTPRQSRRAAIACRLRQLATDPTGSPTTEFALVLPVFLLFLFGVIEFGRVLFTLATLHFAAAEATRFASVNFPATNAEIQAAAADRMVLVDPAGITRLTVISQEVEADQTKLITVEIDYAFRPLLPIGWATIALSGHSRGFLVEK